MKKLIPLLFIIAVVLPNMTTAAPAENQEQESTANLAEQLQDIEEHFLKARERTEKYYVNQLKELKLRVEKKVKLFEEVERAKLTKEEELKKNRYFQMYGYCVGCPKML